MPPIGIHLRDALGLVAASLPVPHPIGSRVKRIATPVRRSGELDRLEMVVHGKERLCDRCYLDRLEVGNAAGHRGEGSICRIPTGNDAHEGCPWSEPGGVVDKPATILKCLEYGVEIHGREPGRIDGRESGRNSCGSAEGNSKVGEVAAGPHVGEKGVFR